jgi:hypothetical protein
MPAGIFNSQTPPADLIRKDFASLITRIMPNGQAPLFAITSMLKDETVYQMEYGYFSKTMVFPKLVINGALAAGATTFVVVDTTNIIPGMVFQVDTTKENILVNTVPDATSVTVTRNFGNTVSLGIATSVSLWMVGNAFEEASLRPQSLIINPTRVTNYTQIFRNTWTISGTLAATQTIAGDGNMVEARRDCALFHAVDIEKALIFGQKFLGTKNGQPIHTMDGVINIVTVNAAGNVTTLGSTTNYTQLEAALDPVFNQVTDPAGKPERVFFVSGTMRRVLHQIFRANGTYFIQGKETNFGLQYDSFKIPRGDFSIVEHPLLNAYGATSTWGKMGIALDLTSFSMGYMQGRKTVSKDFNSAGQPAVDNGIDAVGGSLLTECTCLVKNPAADAILYNATAGVAG